jgi:hypothetical protein
MFLMVYLGLMEAPNGSFNPHGTITEKEAALLMYRAAELGDPGWWGTGAGDAEILDFLFDNEILERSGPNAFNEGAILTNRLALVRLGRLYDFIYSE